MSPSLPKLSYVLLSHNREKYIRAAIESAFAQDYEGELEYIFSDDCSTDRTFEIIKECVAAYKGNRRVVVTQTPRNMRLALHTNHAVSFATGSWIIRADDDDLSSVSRCRIIGDAICRHPEVKFIATNYMNFTAANEQDAFEKSQYSGSFVKAEQVCSIFDESLPAPEFDYAYYFKAWHIDIYKEFSPLPVHADYVDDYFCFHRGCILGPALYLTTEPLVFARVDSGNQSTGETSPDSRGYDSIVAHERFVDKYFNISYEPMQLLSGELEKYVAEHYTGLTKIKAATFFDRLTGELAKFDDYRNFWRKGIKYRWQIRTKYREKGMFSLLRCLPLPLFAGILCTLRLIKRTLDKSTK